MISNGAKKLFVWLVLCLLVLTAIGAGNPASFAAVKMIWGQVILWVVLGGYLMKKNQERIKNYLSAKNKYRWETRFVILATLLALVEEALATFMTNLAPAFGVKIGEAYLTASADFLDVVLFHSVILFIPMFYAWTRLLKKYRFTAVQAFWVFGASGMLSEFLFNQSPLGISGLWFFVYGLMIYLPVFSAPEQPGAQLPTRRSLFWAVIYPFLFVPLTAWLPIVLKHPTLHF